MASNARVAPANEAPLPGSGADPTALLAELHARHPVPVAAPIPEPFNAEATALTTPTSEAELPATRDDPAVTPLAVHPHGVPVAPVGRHGMARSASPAVESQAVSASPVAATTAAPAAYAIDHRIEAAEVAPIVDRSTPDAPRDTGAPARALRLSEPLSDGSATVPDQRPGLGPATVVATAGAHAIAAMVDEIDPAASALMPAPAAEPPATALPALTLAASSTPIIATQPGPHGAPFTEARMSASPGSAEFASQLGSQLSTFVRDGVQHARLHLSPQEMGPVTVQIRIDGQTAQVHMAAEHGLTRQALEQSMPLLASSLREAGLTLSGGGVFEQPRQSRDEAPPGSAAGSQPTADRGDDAALHPGVTVTQRRGVVDLVA